MKKKTVSAKLQQNLYFLCNDDDYAETLKEKFGVECIITSDDSLKSFLNQNKNVEAIITLAELTWDNKKFSEFYGFEVAQHIRRDYKVTVPIFFCSFFQTDSFFYSDKQKSLSNKVQILKASGSYFIHLPLAITDLPDIINRQKPLSTASLIDVIEKCCNPIGNAIDKLHPWKSRINKISSEEFINLCKYLDNILTQEQKESLRFVEFMQEAKNYLNRDDYDGFIETIKKLEDSCIKLFIIKRERIERSLKKDRITVLLIEDDIQICERIKDELSKREIDVNYFRKSKDALEEITNDSDNKYCVIIADWRLYENDIEEWQEYQGYELLEEAAKTHLFAPIALTSLNDSSVHEIRNNLSIKIDLYKKEHLINDNNWNIFADIIHQKYYDIVDLIANLPTSPEWYKSVKRKHKGIEIILPSYYEQYRGIHMGNGWESYEQFISSEADKLWNNFKRIFNDCRPSVKPLKEFGIEINHTIQNLLIVRRIWLALWFKRHYINDRDSIRAIYEIINRGEYGNSGDGQISNKDNVFTNSLAIKTEELPNKGLLPEEKSWLTKKGLIQHR